MTLVTRAFSVIDVSLQLNHSTIKSFCHTLLNGTPKPTCIKGFSVSNSKKHLKNCQKHAILSFIKRQKIERQTFTSTSLSEKLVVVYFLLKHYRWCKYKYNYCKTKTRYKHNQYCCNKKPYVLHFIYVFFN